MFWVCSCFRSVKHLHLSGAFDEEGGGEVAKTKQKKTCEKWTNETSMLRGNIGKCELEVFYLKKWVVYERNNSLCEI